MSSEGNGAAVQGRGTAGGLWGAHVVDDMALGEQQHIVKVLKDLRRRLQQADEGCEAEAVRKVGKRRNDRLQRCTVQPCMAPSSANFTPPRRHSYHTWISGA